MGRCMVNSLTYIVARNDVMVQTGCQDVPWSSLEDIGYDLLILILEIILIVHGKIERTSISSTCNAFRTHTRVYGAHPSLTWQFLQK